MLRPGFLAGPLWAGGFPPRSGRMEWCLSERVGRSGALQGGAGEPAGRLGPAAPSCTDEETESQRSGESLGLRFTQQVSHAFRLASCLRDLRGGSGATGREGPWGIPPLPAHPTLALALQIPSGGGGGTREPSPHLLPGTAAAGGGEGPGERRLGGGGGERKGLVLVTAWCSVLGLFRSSTCGRLPHASCRRGPGSPRTGASSTAASTRALWSEVGALPSLAPLLASQCVRVGPSGP